jgi:hypothetical protein
MNKTHLLFIRACKSKDPKKRVSSVYRRLYLSDHTPDDFALAGILASIGEQYLNYPLSDVLVDLHPHHKWKYGLTESASHWAFVKAVLISKLRLASIDRFPGYIKPKRFK